MYAHGGGAVMGSAPETTRMLARKAINLNCVVFNCGYRLGPEVKAPTGAQDYATSIRHV